MNTSVTRVADLWDVVVSPEGAVCQGAVARLEGASDGGRESYGVKFTQITRHGRVVETVDESRTWMDTDASGAPVEKHYRLHGLQQSQTLAFDHAGRAALLYAAHGHSPQPRDVSRYQWLRYAVREADGRWTLETIREWRIRAPRARTVSAGEAPSDPRPPENPDLRMDTIPSAEPVEVKSRSHLGLGVPDDVHLWCTSSLTFARGGQPMFLLLLTPDLGGVPPCMWEGGEVVGPWDEESRRPPCQRGTTVRTDVPCTPACLTDSELHLLWRGDSGWQGDLVDTGVRYLGSGTQRVRPGFLHFGYDGQPSVAYARTRRGGAPGTRELVLAQRGPDGTWRHDALSGPGAPPAPGSGSARRTMSPYPFVGALPA